MGLMDFAKNIGAELFQSEEEAAAKVKAHIESNNPGIENLEVKVEDGTATVTGVSEDVAAAQKAILMIGNVRGISQVNYDIQPKATEEAPVTEAETAKDGVATGPDYSGSEASLTEDLKTYEVKSGDTLSGIAKDVYGDASKYQKLFEANREVIVDPDKIYPGQVIRVPELR